MQGLVLALAVSVPAVAVAAVHPDAADVPAGAQSIEALPAKATELLERPGDQDWHSILARNPDESINAVFVRVLEGSATCTQPLRVALFNPERRWMRTTGASPGHVGAVLLPRLPSRYLLNISSLEPGCSGVEYEVTYVATDPPKSDRSASRCIVARARRIDAQDRLKLLRTVKPKYAPDAQPRYDRYIARAEATLSAARRSVTRTC